MPPREPSAPRNLIAHTSTLSCKGDTPRSSEIEEKIYTKGLRDKLQNNTNVAAPTSNQEYPP